MRDILSNLKQNLNVMEIAEWFSMLLHPFPNLSCNRNECCKLKKKPLQKVKSNMLFFGHNLGKEHRKGDRVWIVRPVSRKQRP